MDEFNKAFSAFAESVAQKVSAKLGERIESLEKLIRSSQDIESIPKEVTGNIELAEALNVSAGSVGRWKRMGILKKAIVAEFGRTIIYDVAKAKECLKIERVKQGRK